MNFGYNQYTPLVKYRNIIYFGSMKFYYLKGKKQKTAML